MQMNAYGCALTMYLAILKIVLSNLHVVERDT